MRAVRPQTTPYFVFRVLNFDFAGQSDTVFVLRAGATLKNVVIGANQGEGVYCLGGGCTIENVWFEQVCEDAISIVSIQSIRTLAVL